MLESVHADCALINSGTLRSDAIHPKGEFKVRDLKKILPYLDESVCIELTGAQLHRTLENSVSQYPKHEGRFLQVAGVRFAFDPSKPPNERVDPALVSVQGEYLDLKKKYSLVTKTYLKQGKDGYECLMDCPVLIDEENIPMLYNLVENHFKAINLLKTKTFEKFRSSLVPLVVVDKLVTKLSEDPSVLSDTDGEERTGPSLWLQKLNFHSTAFLLTKVLSHKKKTLTRMERVKIKQCDKYRNAINEYEEKAVQLAPKVEGRIICIQSKEHYEELLAEKARKIREGK
jgi:5'-nucleotidase